MAKYVCKILKKQIHEDQMQKQCNCSFSQAKIHLSWIIAKSTCKNPTDQYIYENIYTEKSILINDQNEVAQ